MGAPNLEQLAVLLKRPVKSLAAFDQLTAAQIALLSAAIEQAAARQRQAVKQVLPRPLRWLVLQSAERKP